MNAFTRKTRGVGGLGVVHVTAPTVTATDVSAELRSRGYVTHEVVPPPTPVALTKSMAVRIAVDEALRMLSIPHTTSHPYRAPSPGFAIPQATWDQIVTWCVTVANGYLSKRYTIPSWAQTMVHSGQLSGLSGGQLGGWFEDNPWALKTVGDLFHNYGDHMTVKNVRDSIDAVAANTKGSFTTDDIPALLSMLQQGGYITAGQAGTVEAGARQAAAFNWTPMLIIGGVVAALVLLMGRR